MQCAAQRAQRRILAQQRGGRGLAQRDDEPGLYQFDLAFEIWQTGRDLVRLRRAVIGRAAFDDVGDIDILPAPEFDRQQHVVEQLARLPDERLALRIFIRPRPFTDEQPLGLLVTHAEYRLRATGAQLAGGAIAYPLL